MAKQVGESPAAQTNHLGPTVTREEFQRLTSVLKANSCPWLGCRFFAFFSTVILARLQLSEARRLATADRIVRDENAFLRVTSRKRLTYGNSRAEVSVPLMLVEILDRWELRARSVNLFPNQSRKAPWNPLCTSKGATAIHQLRQACDSAETPSFTFSGLAFFSEANVAWLADSEQSPFRLGPEDMKPKNVPMTVLRQAVWNSYAPSDRGCLKRVKLIFNMLDSMNPKIENTFEMTPEFVVRFAAAAGLENLEGRPQNGLRSHALTWLHIMCNHAIRLGYLDFNPLAGIPGFKGTGWWRDGLRTTGEKSHPRRPRASEDGMIGPPSRPSPWDDWDATICPVSIGDGGEVTIFTRPKKALATARDKTALAMFREFVAAYPGTFRVKYLEGKYGDPRGIIRRYRQSDSDYSVVLSTGRDYGIGINTNISTNQPST